MDTERHMNGKQIAVRFLEIFGTNFQYFKNGYGGYLTYIIVLFSTVSTVYYLMVKNTPWLQAMFPNVAEFFVLGIVTMGPLAVLIGWFEQNSALRRTQMRIDPFQRVQFELFRRIAVKEGWKDLQDEIDFLMRGKKP